MNRVQSKRSEAPAYAWSCYVCAAANPAGRGNCPACGNPANMSMADVAAAKAGSLAPPAAECAPTVPAHTLVAPTSPSNPPTSSVSDVRQQGRKGRFWFYAAAVVAAAVPISAVLILGANGPLLHMGGAGQATRGYWDLSDWTVLGALAVLGLGVPCAALLAFTGIAYRTNPKSVWWIAAVLLGTLGLKILLG